MNYDRLRALGESFFVRKRGLHILRSERRILPNDLIDRVTRLFEAADGGRRDTRPRNDGRIARHILMALDMANLTTVALLQFFHFRFDIVDNIDNRHHGELPAPHALNLPLQAGGNRLGP